MGTVPANNCHNPKAKPTILDYFSFLYDTKCFQLELAWHIGITVPANFNHWWVESLLTVAPSNSEPWNYEWKRLYVGTVPANSCH